MLLLYSPLASDTVAKDFAIPAACGMDLLEGYIVPVTKLRRHKVGGVGSTPALCDQRCLQWLEMFDERPVSVGTNLMMLGKVS